MNIQVELCADEIEAVGTAVRDRMRVLAAQPQSQERDTEMLALASYSQKIMQVASAVVRALEEMKAGMN